MSPATPTVSVCLPTYNRAGSLKRAIDSVLAQTHTDLELVISDNASTDETPTICAAAARADPRVRIVRQPVNRGLTANFNAVLDEARGTYAMLLADDDWLEPDYVASCVRALREQPDVALVSGRARFFRDGAVVRHGRLVVLLDDDPRRRVRRYFTTVRDNPSMFGLMRRETAQAALPMPDSLAGDWLLIARIAMAGKVTTLDDTWINRSAEGASRSLEQAVRSMGLSRWEERHPHTAIAGFVFADVARRSPAYAPLGVARRLRLGLACWWIVMRYRLVAAVDVALKPHVRRRRLRWLDRGVRPLVRRVKGRPAPLPRGG